jgi:hypothetical protein
MYTNIYRVSSVGKEVFILSLRFYDRFIENSTPDSDCINHRKVPGVSFLPGGFYWDNQLIGQDVKL